MTQQQPRIRILTERAITTTPRPGVISRTLAVTYQFPPRPPNVLFIDEDDLPDLVFLRDNPGKTEVPPDVQAKGDAVRRERILDKSRSQGSPAPRTI